MYIAARVINQVPVPVVVIERLVVFLRWEGCYIRAAAEL